MMSVLVLLLGCADSIWNYREMDCEDVEAIALGDGPGKGLVVRSTCQVDVDETCRVKMTGLRGGYHEDGGDTLYGDEIDEIEIESSTYAGSIRLTWGASGASPDVLLGGADRGVEITGGDAGTATIVPGSGGLDVDCSGCDVRATTSGRVDLKLTSSASAVLCVDDANADVRLRVEDEQPSISSIYLPSGFDSLDLGGEDGPGAPTQVVDVYVRLALVNIAQLPSIEDALNDDASGIRVRAHRMTEDTCAEVFDAESLLCDGR